MAYKIGNGTPIGWSFFRRLYLNASDSSIFPKIFARELMPDSPLGTGERLMDSFATPTPRLRDTWGGITGLKIQSNTIAHFQNLFYMESCFIRSDFFANRKQEDSCNPTNWHHTKRVLWLKPSHRSWRGNTRTKKFPVLHLRCAMKRLFFFRGHCERFGQIGCSKHFGGFGPCRYKLGISTWMDLKFGENSKNFAPALKFSSAEWTIRARPGKTAVNLFLAN